MRMQQLSLIRPMGEQTRGLYTLTTWVPEDKRLKEGVKIILKDSDAEWTIAKVWDGKQEFNDIDNRGWDNNNYDKHDGTSMKARIGK